MATEMTPELEARLSAWLADRAPASTPPEFVERVLAIPRTMPVADRPHGIRVIDGGRRRMLLLVAATLTGLGAVGGGLLIAGMEHRDTPPPIVRATPAPVSAPSSSTTADGLGTTGVVPTDVPTGIAHGAVDTPLGTARWVHWQGDGTTFPDPVPLRLPDGRFLWFRGGTSGFDCAPDSTELRCTDRTPSLAVSEGLLTTRRPIPLPTTDPNASFFVSGDRSWFLSGHPAGVWWSDDLGPWQTADGSAIRSPGPAIPWDPDLARPVTIAEHPAMWVRFTAADPGALLGHPGEPVALAQDDRGGYIARLNRRRSEGGPKDLGPITVREAAGAVRFLDAHGREIGRVEGVDRGFVDAWVRRGEIVEQGLFLLDGDRWVPADLPVGPNALPGIVDEGSDGALAIAPDATGQVHLFRSTDGRTWTGGDVLVAPDGAPLVSDDLWVDETDGVRTYIVNRDGSTRWASTDLETWTLGPFPEPPPGIKVAGGWVKTPDQSEDGLWQVSRDRETWEPARLLSSVTTKIAPNGAGGSTETALGDAVWFTVEEAEAPYTRDVWVVEFDAPAN